MSFVIPPEIALRIIFKIGTGCPTFPIRCLPNTLKDNPLYTDLEDFDSPDLIECILPFVKSDMELKNVDAGLERTLPMVADIIKTLKHDEDRCEALHELALKEDNDTLKGRFLDYVDYKMFVRPVLTAKDPYYLLFEKTLNKYLHVLKKRVMEQKINKLKKESRKTNAKLQVVGDQLTQKRKLLKAESAQKPKRKRRYTCVRCNLKYTDKRHIATCGLKNK